MSARVEHVQAGFKADVDQRRRLGHVGGAPGLEEFVAPAEGAGAEAEHGDLEARSAEAAVFHVLRSFLRRGVVSVEA